MKKAAACLLTVLLLCGCRGQNRQLSEVLAFREKLLAAEKCSFSLQIDADFGKTVQEFGMDCEADREGTVHFAVTAPETIRGIGGTLKGEGGKLEFRDTGVTFGYLADGRLNPVSVPWVLLHTLRGGYLTSCSASGDGIRAGIEDSYREDALHMDFWFDAGTVPEGGEISWNGQKILVFRIRNFVLS